MLLPLKANSEHPVPKGIVNSRKRFRSKILKQFGKGAEGKAEEPKSIKVVSLGTFVKEY